MSPIIRVAGLGDVESLAALNGEVQELHFVNRPDQFRSAQIQDIAQWFRELLHNPSAKVWVAEVDGAPVGYVAVLAREAREGPFCPARRWWELDQIGVQAAHRRTGIGRALFQKVSSEARSQGIRDLELNAWAFNQNAQQAFCRLGFAPKIVRFEYHLSDPEPRRIP